MVLWDAKETIEPLIVFMYAVGKIRQHIALPGKRQAKAQRGAL